MAQLWFQIEMLTSMRHVFSGMEALLQISYFRLEELTSMHQRFVDTKEMC